MASSNVTLNSDPRNAPQHGDTAIPQRCARMRDKFERIDATLDDTYYLTETLMRAVEEIGTTHAERLVAALAGMVHEKVAQMYAVSTEGTPGAAVSH